MSLSPSLPPCIRFQPLNANKTLPGGKVWTYLAGTTTPQATYQADGSTPNTNPIILDANGACDLRLAAGVAYKINLLTSDDVQVAGWPVDNISNPLGDLQSLSDPNKGSALVSFSDLLTYPAGSVGRYLADLVANLASSSAASKGAGMVGFGAQDYPHDTVGEKLQRVDSQVYAAWDTSGTAPSFELAPVPALGALTAGARYNVAFHAGGKGSDTLNVSTLGAKSLKQVTPAGAKIAATIIPGHRSSVLFDGTDWLVLSPVQTHLGPTLNYRASCSGNSLILAMSADAVTLLNADGGCITLTGCTSVLNLGATGANGLDVGAIAASTWYHKFFIYNPTTGTLSSLASLSATAPTLPDGYTHFRRMGAFRADSTANKYPLAMLWVGPKAVYCVKNNVAGRPVFANGATSNAWVAKSIVNYVPPTAWEADVVLTVYRAAWIASGGYCGVAPNGNYGNYTSGSGKAPVIGSGITITHSQTNKASIALESTDLYWCSECDSAVDEASIYGWTDSF